MKHDSTVQAWVEDSIIPTYLPHEPDKNPMFLEKRVYQGSSGKVYPLPFTDRISEVMTDHVWKAVMLENEYLKVMILPQIGGRIHAVEDKTTGYNLIYRQNVIKPALVGLAGPWISGGIEFNWPQHHRPATFLPVDYEIEESADGSITVWCSDHDPMARMKGMHGVCLHPKKSVLEVKVRVYNRTSFEQSFLWWANVATRVHEGYQSFFPPDVKYVADHAKRATSEYPLCQGSYYGVNYGERAEVGVPADECPKQFLPPACANQNALHHASPQYVPNDLSWYANIPVPTSYMCMESKADFFGGYDYFEEAGIVHVANHHISPGKKQWTWGNHDFGYAWDRNLTNTDGPYIELMAGVYTDNQPDFSFLQPGETKSWSQYWYPIHKIGPPTHADSMAAVTLRGEGASVTLGVSVTEAFPGSTVCLECSGVGIQQWSVDLAPGLPFVVQCDRTESLGDLAVSVRTADGKNIASWSQAITRTSSTDDQTKPTPATEPGPPEEMASADELYITGLHLLQYRHATRSPVLYWQEAIRRDPFDARCNNAMGLWRLRRGEYEHAEAHLRNAIQRLTTRNPNPSDGEPFYNLGLCLRYQLDAMPHGDENTRAVFDEAYASFYKATWNQAWAAAAFHALAELDCRRSDWPAALEHIERSLRQNTDNLRARNLKARVLFQTSRETEARQALLETLALDPMDWWARVLLNQTQSIDLRTALDVAHDFAVAGFYEDAIALLDEALKQADPRPRDLHDLPTQSWGALPIARYTLGWLYEQLGQTQHALNEYKCASAMPTDYCFPHTLEEIAVLEAAMRAQPTDPRAPYYLGNLLYDRRRHQEAIRLWERSAVLDSSSAVVWRNLGIGYFNIEHDAEQARNAYSKAVTTEPADARLLYERDQLWKRTGEHPEQRLEELERHLDLVRKRDDLSVELCALYNQTGQPEKAQELLASRRFQPWEGGEGQALGQHVRTSLLLGRRALQQDDPTAACAHFETALTPTPNLSEGKHFLANMSQVHYWLGMAYHQAGNNTLAQRYWQHAADFRGDFQEMSVRRFSEMTYYSALSWERLNQPDMARSLLMDLLAYAKELQATEAKIDYFATSLPTMLLFDEDIQFRQETSALFLQAQVEAGLGDRLAAASTLATVLRRDPNHAMAADMLVEIDGT